MSNIVRNRPPCRCCHKGVRLPKLPLCAECDKDPLIHRAFGYRSLSGASKRNVKKECVHCHNVRAVQARGLCKQCYTNVEIRSLYKPSHKYKSHTTQACEVPTLPVLAVYPDKTRLPTCRHGLLDGECPECEEKQRGFDVSSSIPGTQHSGLSLGRVYWRMVRICSVMR